LRQHDTCGSGVTQDALGDVAASRRIVKDAQLDGYAHIDRARLILPQNA